ncbi:glycoside hydrolase family 30 protein [Siphonobacter aquaeclarae]|uniref:Glucosylceramidase n=1 Tax=Siphonobacter aquaeclarae TaxID=563176 RepID=A0A1G9RH97_9BACT|nr:glycoside hydrolase family 30 beta sandwich domain-containing protein [Siphonobacter aquaeclarae]SDM22551.1 glucosylceramidase [Siphonobacter aquaeclarae]
MKKVFLPFLLIAGLPALAQQKAEAWLTHADRSALFARQPEALRFSATAASGPVIDVNDVETFQTIDGFGYALTGGSAQHLIRMSPAARKAVLTELFGEKGNAIGVSYIRLTIGASDLNEKVFSYDDLPKGETDFDLKKFDLGLDRQDVIPVMKEILAINPKIKILGSPWSPPVWMKDNGDTRGGSLKPECFDVYARYFVRYIQEMAKEGIRIDAITVQNEPLHPGNNPSLLMPAPDQAVFVKKNLGPAFEKAGIKTKIIIYDHNADRPDYPISILNDPEARKYIDGSAFHLYNGKIEALSEVHNAYPDKHLYFTEQMVIGKEDGPMKITEPVERLFIGATRNWCRNVLEWNLAADPQNKPFTDRGGCPMCQGAVTIDGDRVSRNIAYYAMAHASKYVRPGSVRIASNEVKGLPNVAFRTPKGRKVLIVANVSGEKQTFAIRSGGKTVTATLPDGSVGTYVW